MAIENLKYNELTGLIIGAAMKVHKYFGFGFPEIVYMRALMIELDKLGIHYKREVETPIYYDDIQIYSRKLDLLVEEIVVVEGKAIKELDKASINQILNCMKVFRQEVGLLLNFGGNSLFFRRYSLNQDSNP